MIDIENEIYSKIAPTLRKAHKGIFITGETLIDKPATFPVVSMYEVDNYVLDNYRTNANIEELVRVVYEVRVFSNLSKGKKQQAKLIASDIDTLLNRLNFTRTQKQPLEFDDVYELVCRYEANVDTKGNIYWR